MLHHSTCESYNPVLESFTKDANSNPDLFWLDLQIVLPRKSLEMEKCASQLASRPCGPLQAHSSWAAENEARHKMNTFPSWNLMPSIVNRHIAGPFRAADLLLSGIVKVRIEKITPCHSWIEPSNFDIEIDASAWVSLIRRWRHHKKPPISSNVIKVDDHLITLNLNLATAHAFGNFENLHFGYCLHVILHYYS